MVLYWDQETLKRFFEPLYLMNSKGSSFQQLETLWSYAASSTGHQMLISDYGGKYTSREFKEYLVQ